jgi:hypothetical protein
MFPLNSKILQYTFETYFAMMNCWLGKILEFNQIFPYILNESLLFLMDINNKKGAFQLDILKDIHRIFNYSFEVKGIEFLNQLGKLMVDKQFPTNVIETFLKMIQEKVELEKWKIYFLK